QDCFETPVPPWLAQCVAQGFSADSIEPPRMVFFVRIPKDRPLWCGEHFPVGKLSGEYRCKPPAGHGSSQGTSSIHAGVAQCKSVWFPTRRWSVQFLPPAPFEGRYPRAFSLLNDPFRTVRSMALITGSFCAPSDALFFVCLD